MKEIELVGYFVVAVGVFVALLICYGMSRWLIRFFPKKRFSFAVAVVVGVIFPFASHLYVLSFSKLHRISYRPSGWIFVATLFFYVMTFVYFIGGDQSSALSLFMIVLAVLPIYSFSLFRTVKVARVLSNLQKMDDWMKTKNEQVTQLIGLNEDAQKNAHTLEATHKRERQSLEKQLNGAEREVRQLQSKKREVDRELAEFQQRRRNLEILSECKEQGVEIGIDANVLMKCDSDFFMKLKENKVVVSKTVHREWDLMKESQNPEKNRRARKAMHRLEELQKGGSVRSVVRQWDYHFLKENVLEDKDNDDLIIADYLYENKQGRNVVALSDDTGFRTSARGAQLPVLDIKLFDLEPNIQRGEAG